MKDRSCNLRSLTAPCPRMWRGAGILALAAALLPALAGLGGTGRAQTDARIEILSGTIRDDRGPVSAAVVRIKGTTNWTLTNEEGRFTLSGLEPGRPVSVTAWARGHYIGGGKPVLPGRTDLDITLARHAAEDDPGYSWRPSSTRAGGPDEGCAGCHSGLEMEPALSMPFDEWLQDAHSRSAVNPRFLTMYEGSDVHGRRSKETRYFSVKDYGTFPLLPEPGIPYYGPGYRLDFPQSEGNCAACHTPAASVNSLVTTDPRGLKGPGAEGVPCDFCHKVIDVRLDSATGLPAPNTPGVLSMEFRRPHQGHQFFAGPFDDVAPGEDTFAPVQRESRFCAPCHFGIFWDTVVYNSYGEWLDSPYSLPGLGKTCQDCHMPTTGAVYCARPDKGGISRDASTIFSHRMPGAADIDLLRHALSLDVAAARDRGRITIRAIITNDRTGHHVPTDSPLRQVILLVETSRADGGACKLLDGPVLPSWCGSVKNKPGHYAGLPGVAFAKVLEEMWTRIRPSGAYWNPTRIVSDNRIAAFSSRTATFVFDCPQGQEVAIRARLIYRRAFIDLMEIKGWDSPDILMSEKRVALPGQSR